MREADLPCPGKTGVHRMHYTEWGDARAPAIVICVHGLTRSGRDFDALAQALQGDLRVVCPDVAGRGSSEWLNDPADYNYSQYCSDMMTLIAGITAGTGPRRIFWVGTSMGGIIGMLLAAGPNNPIERLVINDIGPIVPKAALERIATYVGTDPRFESFEALVVHLRSVSAPFGPLTDEQWNHLARHTTRRHADGSWGFSYDPAIGVPFHKGPLEDVDLLEHWDRISCPTLVLRGKESDLLPRDVAQQMTGRGPRAKLIEFEGIGHAPMLMAPEQIAAVRDFLLGA